MITSASSKPLYYFFLGTEAELIKMFPVIKAFKKQELSYKLIASGQNSIQQSKFLHVLNVQKIDIILSQGKITQTIFGLLFWFITTFAKSIFLLGKEFELNKKRKKIMLVHGDTVSTVMGAILGRIYGLEVVHVEAGLRSFNFLNPFPEEIDRYIVSKLSTIHFCPNEWAVKNLKNEKGIKVNTIQNTLIESLHFALMQKSKDALFLNLEKKDFFIFIMHRQENLLQKEFVTSMINKIQEIAKKKPCLFVVHASTKYVLESNNLWEKIIKDKNILVSSRLDYFVFVHLLEKAKFFITDGGSNQEEAYYLGKPCLIMRKATERVEGLGENVMLSGTRITTIQNFIKHVTKYERPIISTKEKPSQIITNFFIKRYAS